MVSNGSRKLVDMLSKLGMTQMGRIRWYYSGIDYRLDISLPLLSKS